MIKPYILGLLLLAVVHVASLAEDQLRAPFDILPDARDFGLCVLQDADGDGTCWSLSERPADFKPVFMSGSCVSGDTEDWLFFPAFTGSGTSVYTLSFDVSSASAAHESCDLEAWIGTSPDREGMRRCLIPATNASSIDPVNYYVDFVIDGELAPAPALYVGLVARGRDKEDCPVMVTAVKVAEKATDLSRPSAVINLRAFQSEMAPETATVSFTFPDTFLDGTPIPSTVSLKSRVSVVGMKSVDKIASPGESVTLDVAARMGSNLIIVTPTMGNERGLSTDVSCRIGPGLPASVRALTVTYDEDNLGLRLDWKEPATDIYGRPSDSGDLSYRVWLLDSGNRYELVDEVPAGVLHSDFRVAGDTDLVNLRFFVAAVNGNGEGPRESVLAQVGKPYTMPMQEDFSGSEYAYGPFTIFSVDQYSHVEYGWGSPSELDLPERFHVGGVGSLVCAWPFPGEKNVVSRIWIPKFSTVGYQYVDVLLDVWAGADAPQTTVTGLAYGMDRPVDIATLPRDREGYANVAVHLPAAMCRKPWVQISLDTSYPDADSRLALAGYRVVRGTSVEGVAGTPAGTVTGENGLIRFVGFNGGMAEIYTPEGRNIASVRVDSDLFLFNIARGLYIVRTAGRSFKVMVC